MWYIMTCTEENWFNDEMEARQAAREAARAEGQAAHVYEWDHVADPSCREVFDKDPIGIYGV